MSPVESGMLVSLAGAWAAELNEVSQ